MSEVIFQETTCAKKDTIAKIVELMKGAGWKDVSSNPTTDFYVLQSTGESGDKNLHIQIRSTATGGGSTTDTATTDTNAASVRLVSGYTPGSPGVAGIFDRAVSPEAWRNFYIAPTTTAINLENEMRITYNVNKDRIILIIETPDSLGFAPVTHYIGLPESFIEEPGSKGLILASSAYAVTASAVHITDNANDLAPLTASATRPTYITLPPRSPNSAGKHTPVQAFYGNTTEGWRGRIDGLYFLPAGSVTNGDTFSVGNKTFKGFVNGVASNNSFITTVALVQIS